MEALRWLLVLSPLLLSWGSAQPLPFLPQPLPHPLPQPLPFPALLRPGPLHILQAYAPESAPGAGLAPAALVFPVRDLSAWLKSVSCPPGPVAGQTGILDGLIGSK